MSEILVVGAGAWGTALAIHCARQGHDVLLQARHPARIGRENPRLPGHLLPPNVRVVAAPPRGPAAMLVAVPTQHLRETLMTVGPIAPLLLCCKGLEHATGLLPMEIAAAALPGEPGAILTGPNFAHEIAAGLPAASVIAGGDAGLRAGFIDLLTGPGFRLYGNDDAVGCQLGGAAKNVIAVAAGAVTGAGLGENARAALVTRGLAEIARLAVALAPRAGISPSALASAVARTCAPCCRTMAPRSNPSRPRPPSCAAPATSICRSSARSPTCWPASCRFPMPLPGCSRGHFGRSDAAMASRSRSKNLKCTHGTPAVSEGGLAGDRTALRRCGYQVSLKITQQPRTRMVMSMGFIDFASKCPSGSAVGLQAIEAKQGRVVRTTRPFLIICANVTAAAGTPAPQIFCHVA
jgi:glycerol-3-phosphate dehydrogenase